MVNFNFEATEIFLNDYVRAMNKSHKYHFLMIRFVSNLASFLNHSFDHLSICNAFSRRS